MKSTGVFPVPRQVVRSEQRTPRFGACTVRGDEADRARAILDPGVFGTESGETLHIECHRVNDDELAIDPISGHRHDEGYRLVSSDGGKGATVEYVGGRGLRFALATLVALVNAREWGPGTVVFDAPRFPLRGIIEGYYGPPWSPTARRDVLELMSRHKMNTYFYGPKDDAYHRRRWRELYPPEVFEELTEAVQTTGRLDMDFWYTIGPGLSMEYSSDDDFASLEAKLFQVAQLGVRRFGLLFDDIPPRLQHETDRNRFSNLPEAHARVANALYAALRERIPDVRLAVCPTQYHGAGSEPYISELGTRTDPRIDILWTGPQICSRELTLRDAAVLERTISRPVLYWDNYPVNDCEMIHELHIGPYRGRDPHLYRASIGVVANGMEYPESSKIGLLTVADYLWNPEAYDPEHSWDYALETVVGSADWNDFRIFADNNRYSALYPTDAPHLSEQLQHAGFLRVVGREDDARVVLDETVGWLRRAVALFDRGMENTVLQGEIGRWIEKYRKGIELLEARIRVDAARAPDAVGDLVRAARAYREDREYVFADVLDSLLDDPGEGDLDGQAEE